MIPTNEEEKRRKKYFDELYGMGGLIIATKAQRKEAVSKWILVIKHSGIEKKQQESEAFNNF